MPTYIALLRGINVSGHRKVKMTELQLLFEGLGFKSIQTYIQSGNVVFRAEKVSEKVLATRIESAFFDKFKFEVPIIVKRYIDFKNIIMTMPWEQNNETDLKFFYFVVLESKPSIELREKLEEQTFPNEKFKITDECVYLNCLKGYGNAKCNNNFFENKLKVSATTRNYKTMLKLLDMAHLI